MVIHIELSVYCYLFYCNPLFCQAANCLAVHPVSAEAVIPTEAQYLARAHIVFYSTFYQFML